MGGWSVAELSALVKSKIDVKVVVCAFGGIEKGKIDRGLMLNLASPVFTH